MTRTQRQWTCIKCGNGFEPASGTNRRCPNCRRRPIETGPPVAAATPDDFERVLERASRHVVALPRPDPIVLNTNMSVDDELGFGPQTQVALFSDYQRAKVVAPADTGGIGHYDTGIAQMRLGRYRDGVARYRQTYRFPIERLVVLALGDDIEGCGQIYPAQAYFLDDQLLGQVMGFVSDMEQVLRFWASIYPQVDLYHVYGNHGRLGKKGERPDRDNIETIMWFWLKDRLADVENLAIHVSTSFYMLVEILGHKFMIAHGEDVRPMSPYAQSGGQNTKLRWNAMLGDIVNYLCIAHWHFPMEFEKEIGGAFMVNGSFIGPDALSVKWIHEAVLPSQKIFAVHRKYGITHKTDFHLATAAEIRDVPIYGRDVEIIGRAA